MNADRRLIEAQVEFGMFPEGALISDTQETILNDAVAGRVHRINQAAAVKRPRSNPARIAFETLGRTIRTNRTHQSIWQVAARQILNSFDNADELVQGVSVSQISNSQRLRASTRKSDLAQIQITLDFENGKQRTIGASTAYGYLMASPKM